MRVGITEVAGGSCKVGVAAIKYCILISSQS